MKLITEEVREGTERLLEAVSQHVPQEAQKPLFEAVSNLSDAFEKQVVLMFDNFNASEEVERAALLVKKAQIAEFRKAEEEANLSLGISPGENSISAGGALLESSWMAQGGAAGSSTEAGSPTMAQGESIGQYKSMERKKKLAECAVKALHTSIYCLLEALASNLKAERVVLMSHQKTSNTLTMMCSVPHRLRRVQIPGHVGVVGLTLTSSVAFNANTEDEDAQIYLKPTDSQLGVTTKNLMCFPVLQSGDPGCVAGTLEIANKYGGKAPFTEEDEQMAHQAARLLSYMMTHYPRLDFSTQPQFDPSSSLHGVQAWAPTNQPPSLPVPGKGTMDSTRSSQLVFRSRKGKELVQGSRIMRPERERDKPANEKVQRMHVTALKEVYSYLNNLEESYRQALNQFVQSDRERSQLNEDVSRKNHKIRILEDNIDFLEGQVGGLRAQIESSATDPPLGHNKNYRDFKDVDGKVMDPDEEVGENTGKLEHKRKRQLEGQQSIAAGTVNGGAAEKKIRYGGMINQAEHQGGRQGTHTRKALYDKARTLLNEDSRSASVPVGEYEAMYNPAVSYKPKKPIRHGVRGLRARSSSPSSSPLQRGQPHRLPSLNTSSPSGRVKQTQAYAGSEVGSPVNATQLQTFLKDIGPS